MEMNQTVVTAAEQIKDLTLQEAAKTFIERAATTGEGMEQQLDFQVPYVRLVQAMTDPDTLPEGASKGQYVIGVGQEAEVMPAPLNFYMLMVEDGRSYFEASTDDKKPPRMLCFSPDGVYGKLGACKECAFSKWEDGAKSSCRKNRTVIGLTPDFDLIFKYVFSKTGYQEGLSITKKLRTIRGVASTYDFLWALDSTPYPERKTVMMPVISVASKAIAPDVKVFLKELTQQIHEDHKSYVTYFRENMVEQDAIALEHNADGTSSESPDKLAELTFDVDN
jgi:hypothetical protein